MQAPKRNATVGKYQEPSGAKLRSLASGHSRKWCRIMPAATATLSDSMVRLDRNADETLARALAPRRRVPPLRCPTTSARGGRGDPCRSAGRRHRRPRAGCCYRRGAASSAPRRPGAREMEESTHCATDDFGVPEVNGSGRGKCGAGAQSRGGAKHRAGVAGILHAVEHEHPRARRKRERFAEPAGISAIARIPCGDSVVAALAKSRSFTSRIVIPRASISPRSAAPRAVVASAGATIAP